MHESERPTFTVGRVGKDGLLDFDRVTAFAEAVLGRTPTAEEIARQRARWRERFPEDPTAQEPGR
jgi:hypothetical protein